MNFISKTTAFCLWFLSLVGTARADRWEVADSMINPRFQFEAVSLADGRVLVCGGYTYSSSNGNEVLSSCEIFDPSSGKWTATGSMIEPRKQHSCTLLSDGRVLVVGGSTRLSSPGTNNAYLTERCEIYDPATGVWSPTGSMSIPRANAALVLLPNAKILIAGGSRTIENDPSRTTGTSVAEIFDPTENRFQAASPLLSEIETHQLILLNNGQVLSIQQTGACTQYDYLSNAWSHLPSINSNAGGVLMRDGRILALSSSYYGSVNCVFFNPAKSNWENGPALQNPGFTIGAPTPLISRSDGKVLWMERLSTQILDPMGQAWTVAGHTSPHWFNYQDFRAMLPDGRVLSMNETGEYNQIFWPDGPLSVSVQPTSLAVNQGERAEISVMARGTGLNYLWRKNGKNLSANNRTLVIPDAQPSDQGFYFVIVSGAEGVVTSNTVTLTVVAKPEIVSQPRDVVCELGQNAVFSVGLTAVSAAGSQYQWFKNGIAIPDANTAILTIQNVKSSDVGTYSVTARNTAGEVSSSSASLDIFSQELFGAALAFGFDMGFEQGVKDIKASPNKYDLYSVDQIRNLNLSTPLLQKNSTTGKFTLRIQGEKSGDLGGFSPLSFRDGDVTVAPDGTIQFEFNSSDKAAFYRLRAR